MIRMRHYVPNQQKTTINNQDCVFPQILEYFKGIMRNNIIFVSLSGVHIWFLGQNKRHNLFSHDDL